MMFQVQIHDQIKTFGSKGLKDNARAAGEYVAHQIRTKGFAEFEVAIFRHGEPVFEIEWTDPDLFLEPEDIAYFISYPVPRQFVRRIYINWQAYCAACNKQKIRP